LAEDLRAVVRFLGLRAAVVRLRADDFFLPPVRFRAVVLLRAVDFRPVDLRDVRFLAVDFLAVDFRVARFRVVFRAAVRLRPPVVFFLPVVRLRVDFLRAVAMVTSLPRSGRHALQASSFPLAHAPPHAVTLVASQRVVEAFDPDRALRADAFRFARRSSLLGEENLRVELPASRSLLPRDVVVHAARSPARTTFV
jgi:hypothetical protein